MKRALVFLLVAVLAIGSSACHTHKWDASTGKCSDCGEEHEHSFDADGLCAECGYACQHRFNDSGVCNICGAATIFKWKNFAVGSDALTTLCEKQGSVVSLEYDTPAYAVNDLKGVDVTLHKKLNVYLPYGYDETKQYNVLYLLHGTRGTDDGPMEDYWLIQNPATVNLLDNMFASGRCEPFIVVTPKYYSEVENYELTDEDAKALSDRMGDGNLWSSTSADGGAVDNAQNIWTVYFGKELREVIIPLVESTYSTYAGGDVSETSLAATREHRALAGLSRGSMTVARAGLTESVDLFAWFGNYSGIWQEFDTFKAAMDSEFAGYEVKGWFNGTGKNDFALKNHKVYRDRTLSELSGHFTEGENYWWVSLYDGAHFYETWLTHLYNSMLVFFK